MERNTVFAEKTTLRERAIHLEGALFGPDLLEQVQGEDLTGQKPKDFGLPAGRSLLEEIAATWRDALDLWRVFRRRLERLPEGDSATSLTREGWVIPFLGLLGYELHYNARSVELGEMSFFISHRAGGADDAPPVHIVSVRQELGRSDPHGRPRISPHALMQEFLNRSDHLWGIVTNGRVLRLLRKSSFLRRQSYFECDLETLFEGERFGDFVVLFRLLHRSRLPQGIADAPQCFLETYHRVAQEEGDRARDRLREGVEQCLRILGNGFLHASKDVTVSDPLTFYHDLLRLVYRFLFLLVAEERHLLGGNDLFREHYSLGRLRRLADRFRTAEDHEDLWHGLRVLFHLLTDATPYPDLDGKPLAHLLGLSVLDGELFRPITFDDTSWVITNRHLLEALFFLFYYEDRDTHTFRRVNYAALDVEELGSVYESLLDNHPEIVDREFRFAAGTERKSTGSYYTPHELVDELLKSALEPVLWERLSPLKTQQEKEAALLSLRVLDPACGSGHFLLAAARRLGKELARIRTGEDEPSPEVLRECVREVVSHCLYGVDRNPLAVELCKVSLWIESHLPGRPLTFLDHRIRVGDSLVGVFDLRVLDDGIPDGAFDPVTGDDKAQAQRLKKSNRLQRQALRTGQIALPFNVTSASRALRQVLQVPERTAEDLKKKAELYHAFYHHPHLETMRQRCDLYTAAFFQNIAQDAPPITTETLREQTPHPRASAFAQGLAFRHHFFHWPLEFPDAFAQGGFDVVLCNPPWERIKLQEEEFFLTRDARIAQAPNKAARAKLIQNLRDENPSLWAEYQDALHFAESLGKFLRQSGRFPLTARGDINTYSVFSELFLHLLSPHGRAGFIVPTGIATDDTNKHFFAHLVESGKLVSLFDFENREKLFPAVDSRYRFALLTIGGQKANETHFAFFLTRTEGLRHPLRRFSLTPSDLSLLNPNTRTCPIFRTRQDAELTRFIYRRVPVLLNEQTGANPWDIRFLAMFHMANDSHLFRTRDELAKEGFTLQGNRMVKGDEVYLPLYEAKMIYLYNHRYGTFAGVSSRSDTHLPTPPETALQDPDFTVLPWYFVPAEEVNCRLGSWNRGWLLGWRDITNATNERTLIASVIPRVGVGNKIPLMIFEKHPFSLLCCFLGNLSSLVCDFVVRQKIGGTTLNFFYVKQLPLLPPSAYTEKDLLFIVPRVLELVYTAWDIQPFAEDIWKDSDPTLRRAILNQWSDAMQEHTDPSLVASSSLPLPPFRFSTDRRVLCEAELNAYYAHLYGLSRKMLRYILDPLDLTEKELQSLLDPQEEVSDPLDPDGYRKRTEESTFPGETFRVLKEKEIREYGFYRTRELVLRAYQDLFPSP